MLEFDLFWELGGWDLSSLGFEWVRVGSIARNIPRLSLRTNNTTKRVRIHVEKKRIAVLTWKRSNQRFFSVEAVDAARFLVELADAIFAV